MLNLNLPRRFNAAQYFVDRNVEEGRGERPAIFFEDQTYTYHEVLEKVNRAANMLRNLGVEMENRVMLLLRDSPEMIFSFFGAIKSGAVPIPTNILMKSQDFLYVLNDSRAKVLIVDSIFLPEIEKIRDQATFCKKIVVVGGEDPAHLSFDQLMGQVSSDFEPAETTCDDPAFWLYSGRNPEVLMGAVHHHSHMVYCTEAYARGILNMTEEDRVLGSFLFFAYGLGNSVYFPFGVGGATVLINHRPTPDLMYEDLVKYRPTLFFTVPTLLSALADYKKTCRQEGRNLPSVDSLRACISSAEILSPEVYHRFREEFGVEVLDGTGSTEICHIFLSNRFGGVKLGSTGKVVPGYRTRLIDEDGHPVSRGEMGHLLVSGGSTASVYWNMREETKRNMLGEWFVTGDRYLEDEDGFYYFRGRSDDMLRVGGKWLAPKEVENALNQHPAVAESAVVGHQDKEDLIKPYAFIVLKPDCFPSDELKDEIKAFVKEKIAVYKYPRWIDFIEAIPKTPGGKVQRFVLQEKIQGLSC
ncbi:MAG: benzoate-CoA ligase family protein [Desulfobacteraceae bacterium]|nr:benzoate-CoA ligase family protein [Desulfobacterales bacterium]MBL6968333.1 benzoate-CoA ligase family protein [Desulfobacteraceae bacterium]MBL7102158.1 benzoate-CoA ligase family protein [Desulfobacteraceae bacterium]MBL7171334.1 benzoate-CoA ligase family protein [Desulfobacteraceae bacterium]